MKRIIFLLCNLLLAFTIVQADNKVFDYDWETDYVYDESGFSVWYSGKTNYKNGYVTSKYDDNGSILKYYDLKGTEINSKEYTDYTIFYLSSNEDKLYALGIDKSNNELLILLNEDLSVSKSIILSKTYDIDDIYDILDFKSWYGFELIAYEESNIYVYASAYSAFYQVDKDLNTKTSVTRSDEFMEKYFPGFFINSTNRSQGIEYTGYLKYDSKVITTYYNKSNSSKSIIKMEENNKVIWEKEVNNYIVRDPKIVANYIVVTSWGPNSRPSVLIFDLDGNLVQTIKGDEFYDYLNLSAYNDSFIFTSVKQATCKTEGKRSCLDYNEIVYYLQLNIATKVEGKGNVEVINTARDGEEVTFKITPEEGYVLGEVKVTDANGNVLTFTSNTFTMPSSDVTIEATFLPENPDTKDMKIITASIILILGSIYGFISLRKYKWLK